MNHEDAKDDWLRGRWMELTWIRPLQATPEDWRGIVGYDGYRRSYVAALYYLDGGDSFLTWAIGNEVGDDIPDFESLLSRCMDWDEFPYAGAVDWSAEGDLGVALFEAPDEADRRQLHQKWYVHDSGDLEIWSRMYELHELKPEGIDDEKELYDRGYVLGRHFSERTGERGEIAHVLRANLARWIAVRERLALEALARLNIPPDAADSP